MKEGVELVPLECIRCGVPIPAELDEVAWRCGNCGQGQQLSEAGLAPLTIHFAASPASADRKPFWSALGQVRFTRRTSYGSDSPPDPRWSQPVRFWIPAFRLPADRAVAWGGALVRKPPSLQEGEPSAVTGVVLSPDRIDPLVRFVVVSLEAERRDNLEAVEFTVELEPAELWCLPFDSA